MNNKYSAGQKPTFTRKISPKMGLLGFWGCRDFWVFCPGFFVKTVFCLCHFR